MYNKPPPNPTAFRKAKIICNLGLYECNMVKQSYYEREEFAPV